MIKYLPYTVILLFFNSCASYRYYTINSADVTQNDKHEFVIENDSLRLVYNFNGFNAPVNITIKNKLSVPVYIDWQRSALIVNDQAISYVPAEMRIDGGFYGSSYKYGNSSGYKTTSGQIQATASLPPSVDFMPPQTYLTKSQLSIPNRFIGQVPETAFYREKYKVMEGRKVSVKRATFTEATTPLRFRSYLTLMVGELTNKPLTLEHSFYISELMTTGAVPTDMHIISAGKGNMFYQ